VEIFKRVFLHYEDELTLESELWNTVSLFQLLVIVMYDLLLDIC